MIARSEELAHSARRVSQRGLDADKIVQTVLRLQQRITERFPGSGLSQVAAELHQIANEAVVRSAQFRRPNFFLRIVTALVVGAVAVLLGGKIQHLQKTAEFDELVNFMQFFEASLGSIVFLGAAILFLVTLEVRLKRRRALQALYELRALAHIVDMHQLTKDPERLVRGPKTASSPQRTMTPFLLFRYLDYCTELLAMISKIAALYVQNFPDEAALAAVDQVEDLTNGLSRKIWQKIMILNRGSELDGDAAVTELLPEKPQPAPERPASERSAIVPE